MRDRGAEIQANGQTGRQKTDKDRDGCGCFFLFSSFFFFFFVVVLIFF